MIDLSNKKILLVRNDNVGDLVCTTPAIEALRIKYPSAKIDIVVNSYNYDAINNNKFINNIYCYTKPKHKKIFIEKIKAGLGKLKILFDIRKEKYDAVVIFRSGYSKSAELFAKISNAEHKIGVKNPKGKDSFSIHIIPDHNKNEVEFCFDCLDPFSVKLNNEKTFYYVDEKLALNYKEYKNKILFHISSRILENKYSEDNYSVLFKKMNNYNIIISAEPDDFHIAENLSAKHDNVDFVKTKSLHDLAALIKNVKLFVTLDGGAMHIAPAVGTKTICISGKTNMNKWYPWGYKDLVIQDSTMFANNINSDLVLKKIEDNI